MRAIIIDFTWTFELKHISISWKTVLVFLWYPNAPGMLVMLPHPVILNIGTGAEFRKGMHRAAAHPRWGH